MQFYPIKTLGKVVIQLCFFFYLYSVQLVILPLGLGSRIALAMCGLVVMLFTIQKESQFKKSIFIQHDVIRYTFLFAAIIFISLITIILNDTRDFEFVKYPLSIVFILLAAYFIHFLIKKVHKKINYEIIMKYIIIAVLIQQFISLISFLSPQVNSFLMAAQNLNELDTSKIEETGIHRFIGFGSTFFGAGVMNGFTLMIIAVLLKRKRLSNAKIFAYALSFFIILLLGIMMARTTLVGLGLALIYLFMPSFHMNKNALRNKWKFLLFLLIIPAVCITIIFTFFPTVVEELTAVINFSFELFINYSKSGNFTTASTNQLADMYILPKSLKTYLIGDGQYYINPGDRTSAYYMHTDAGYLRLVYYFGIIGTFCYISLQYFTIRNAILRNKRNRNFVQFMFFCFLFFMILNIKAFTDIIFLVTLFCYPFEKSDNMIVAENTSVAAFS